MNLTTESVWSVWYNHAVISHDTLLTFAISDYAHMANVTYFVYYIKFKMASSS